MYVRPISPVPPPGKCECNFEMEHVRFYPAKSIPPLCHRADGRREGGLDPSPFLPSLLYVPSLPLLFSRYNIDRTARRRPTNYNAEQLPPRLLG